MSSDDPQTFYEKQYSEGVYAPSSEAQSHSFYSKLRAFTDKYQLYDKRVLEIGCGRGAFQDIVHDYVGVDLSENAGKYLHKPFFQASANELPFADNSFDAAWTYAVLEHVPDPERALHEMRRVLKSGGLLLLAPAWQCRSWAANGYPVRPYSDFDLKGKLVKASIPIRNSIMFRSFYVFPQRLYRLVQYKISNQPIKFTFRKIKPNYETYWMSDSDAVNSMDPYNAILWFCSRGDSCLSYPTERDQFLVQTSEVVFQIQK